jgi:MFS family permease
MSAAAVRPVSPSEPAPFAEPTTPVAGGWIALFATAWLGVWMAQLTPIQLLLPQQVESQLAASNWIDTVTAFGIISGIAALCALVAYPLTGALSDRTVSRFGRRRPWIAAGAAVFALSLLLLGMQHSLVGIGIFWSLALTGFCMLSAALTATISDRVPVNQRGIISGWVSAPQAIGTVLGLVLVLTLFASQVAGYTAMAVLLVLLVVPFVILMPDDPVRAASDRERLGMRHLVQGFWISPRRYPDFARTLGSRILVNLSNALGTALLLYFIMFGLDRPATAEDDLLLLTVVYLVFFIAAALLMGRLSDRIGRRKPFVYLSALVQASAALLLALVPHYTVTLVAAGLLGVGYGCFMAVDQALATQVLPDAVSRGKDLGIMNIAMAVPQAMAPLLGAWVVAAVAGFTGLFLLSAVTAILGGLLVLPLRSVR